MAPAALRLPGLARAVRLTAWGFEQLSPVRAVCVHARAFPFLGFAASSSSSSSPFSTLVIGTDGIRNPFNLQRSKLTSARVLGRGLGGTQRRVPGKRNISPLCTARFCVLPPSSFQPPPFSWPLRWAPPGFSVTTFETL